MASAASAAAAAPAAASPPLEEKDADMADAGPLPPGVQEVDLGVEELDPSSSGCRPDIPFGENDSEFVEDGSQRKSYLNQRKTRLIELAGQLWQQCGCMCAVVIVTRELQATLYATHGNYLTAHAHVARLAEFKEHARTRHHHVIDFPQLMAAFTRARGAAAAYAMTLARTLDGLVRTPILRRAEERAAALVGEDGVAAGDALKRQLETVLAAYAAPDSPAALALARALEVAGAKLLDGGDDEPPVSCGSQTEVAAAGGDGGGSGSGGGSGGGGGGPRATLHQAQRLDTEAGAIMQEAADLAAEAVFGGMSAAVEGAGF
jgi:uncharacterized membrane protein YgcG